MPWWKIAIILAKKAAKIANKFATSETIGYEIGSKMSDDEKQIVVYNVTTKIIESETNENLITAASVFVITFILTLLAYAIKVLLKKKFSNGESNSNEITVNDPKQDKIKKKQKERPKLIFTIPTNKIDMIFKKME